MSSASPQSERGRSTQSDNPQTSPGPINGKRKRRYSRSRGGCLGCKRIKKKCDQRKPSCLRCSQINRECSYPVPAEVRNHTQGASSGPSLHDELEATLFDLSTYSSLFGPPVTNVGAGATLQENSLAQDRLSVDHGRSRTDVSTPIQDGGGAVEENMWTDPTALSMDDSFLQAFLGAGSFVPFPEISPDIAQPPHILSTLPASSSTTSHAKHFSGALLSVPLNCDASLWSSFVDSTLWNTRVAPPGEDGHLMEYFMDIASTTVVVRNIASTASRFYAELASLATARGHSALMHSVMCVSAQHLTNWARKGGDMEKVLLFGDTASRHKAKALSLLRVASTDSTTKNDAISPAVLVMLLLAANLKGETEIISPLLGRAKALLHRIDHGVEVTFLPTVSAIHSVYTGFHSLSNGIQPDLDSLFPNLDEQPVWAEQAKDVCEQIYGMSLTVFLLLLRIDSLAKQSATILDARLRSPEDEELLLMEMEIKSEASGSRTDLLDKQLFAVKYNTGCSDRVILRNGFYRLAGLMVILRGIFHEAKGSPRLESIVSDMLTQCHLCSAGMEIGLLWPYIIIASEATPAQQPQCLDFIKRCQWKGSSGPIFAETVVRRVWENRNIGRDLYWRDVTIELGSPLII